MMALFVDPIRYGTTGGLIPYPMDRLTAALDNPELGLPVLMDPGEAYDRFAECLITHRPFAVPLLAGPLTGFAAPSPDFPAVRFASLNKTEPSIELVPGCEGDLLWDQPETAPSSALSYLVFPESRQSWLGTNPGLHTTTLDCSPGGADYTCRELIRLIKLIKYRHSVPIRSYFLELFALRWIEGSHDLPATTVAEIINQMMTAGRRPYIHTGTLSADASALLGALAGQLQAAARAGQMLTTVDLTTPEQQGRTDACDDLDALPQAAGLVTQIADQARTARDAEVAGDVTTALAGWQRLIGQHP